MLYEVHNLRATKGSNSMPNFRGHGVGSVVDCEGGSLAITQGYSRAYDENGKQTREWQSGDANFETIIRAVRSGKRSDPTAEIEEGHLSTRICHVGNISLRMGAPATVQQQRKQIEDVPLFAEMHDRLLQHMNANEIDPATATLGTWLECDNEKECFKDNAKANELVKGYYREPFAVPDLSARS